MKKFILITLLIVILSGCENKNPDGTETKKTDTTKSNKISSLAPVKYKGMYFKEKENRVMTECGSGKNYLISAKGEIAILDSVFSSLQKSNPKQKLYLNAEGFSSVQEKAQGKGFDTVLVITRLIGTDTTFNCE
ncbi:MAG: hypothetical protein IPL53_24655 [Ignavibacteria bacterium]|nr:hypothetical protein [Ignavibacteria bacterium]